jgi:hypothetical protein
MQHLSSVDTDAPADDTMPEAISALIETYDVAVYSYEDGTTPSAQLAPSMWATVVRRARLDGALRAVRVTLGSAWCVAVVDVGDTAVTLTAAPDPTRSLTLLDLTDL